MKKLDNKAITQYDRDGWLHIENYFSRETIEAIQKQIDEYIDLVKEQVGKRDINYAQEQVNSFHALHQSPDIIKLIQEKQLVEFIKPLMRGDTGEIRASEYFAKPARIGMPVPIHQDNYYWCVEDHNALTLWVALDECSAENGGIFYYSGSHKLGLLEHEASFAKGSSQKLKDMAILDTMPKVLPHIKPGDILIHDTLTLHGSEPNTSGKPRRGWTIQIKGAHSGYDAARKAAYEEKLNQQIALRNAELEEV